MYSKLYIPWLHVADTQHTSWLLNSLNSNTKVKGQSDRLFSHHSCCQRLIRTRRLESWWHETAVQKTRDHPRWPACRCCSHRRRRPVATSQAAAHCSGRSDHAQEHTQTYTQAGGQHHKEQERLGQYGEGKEQRNGSRNKEEVEGEEEKHRKVKKGEKTDKEKARVIEEKIREEGEKSIIDERKRRDEKKKLGWRV